MYPRITLEICYKAAKLSDGNTVLIFLSKSLVALKPYYRFRRTRSVWLMTIAVTQPQNLLLVWMNTEKDFLRYIGYLNCTKDHIQGVPKMCTFLENAFVYLIFKTRQWNFHTYTNFIYFKSWYVTKVVIRNICRVTALDFQNEFFITFKIAFP